jgi:hypothetical protein
MAKVKEFQKIITDDIDFKETVSGDHVCECRLPSILPVPTPTHPPTHHRSVSKPLPCAPSVHTADYLAPWSKPLPCAPSVHTADYHALATNACTQCVCWRKRMRARNVFAGVYQRWQCCVQSSRLIKVGAGLASASSQCSIALRSTRKRSNFAQLHQTRSLLSSYTLCPPRRL